MYPLWKFLHVLGAVLMLGNVIVTGLWATLALRRPDPAVHAFAARAIQLADLAFTFVGGAMLTIGGIQMVRAAGLPWWETPWLRDGVLALAGSTAVWLVALLPDQFRMERLAAAGDVGGLRKAFMRWSVLGWTATAMLVWALWRMVVKG